jgi:hypothetical protein
LIVQARVGKLIAQRPGAVLALIVLVGPTEPLVRREDRVRRGVIGEQPAHGRPLGGERG